MPEARCFTSRSAGLFDDRLYIFLNMLSSVCVRRVCIIGINDGRISV